MFWKKKPRFRDIPAKSPELPRSTRIAFFAPHTSEHQAVMPLISVLQEKLGRIGVETETHSVENMRDSVLSLSAKLNTQKFSKKGKVALESFFRMRDAALRLHLLEGILADAPEKFVVEVHALPMDYLGDEKFPLIGHYFRIPGTRVLFPRDQKSQYETPIRDGVSLLRHSDEQAVRFAKKLLCLENMEKGDADMLLAGVDWILKRTLLIEIPAPSKQNADSPLNTDFEMNHGIRISESNNLRIYEVERLVELLSGLLV